MNCLGRHGPIFGILPNESFIGEPWEWGQEGGLLGSSWSNIQRAFFTSISRVAAFPPTQKVNPGVISPIRSTGL